MTILSISIENRLSLVLDQFLDYIDERADNAAEDTAIEIGRLAENLAPKDTGNLSVGHYVISRKRRYASMPSFSAQGRTRSYPSNVPKRVNEFHNSASRSISRFNSGGKWDQVGQALLGFSASYAEGMNDKKEFLKQPQRYTSLMKRVTRESYRSRFRY